MAFRGFLQDRPTEPSPPAVAYPRAPGTSIGYDPMLIKRLRNDHKRLLNLFAQVQALLTTADYDGVRRKLGEMRIVLQEHLVVATTKFYVYVARQLASRPSEAVVVNSHRRAMLGDSREIMDFLSTYGAIRLDDQSAPMFQAELLEIGAVLVRRFEREESTLFPLYRAIY
jgi:hypothetical protein